ncbi:MAG TPA: hypothetical protein VK171_09740 [Fimbriimonas sp.]|nr:hypothetical protein [Fimbriimonas sp.]
MARGQGMPDASVRFNRCLSLLTGPSDTGKSFVGDAINHVFGASGPLRHLTPEQASYDRLFVEILSYESGEVYTLERAWAGGGILLHRSITSKINEYTNSTILKDSHDGTTDSVSGFLLHLCGLEGKFLRKNESGAKDSLSFRNLPMYILVEEDRIITKQSPILTGNPQSATKELNLFKCIITGVDDSAIVPGLDAKVRKGLSAGRKEVLDSLIADVQLRISSQDSSEEQVRGELQVVQDAIDQQTSFLHGATAQLDELEIARKSIWDARQVVRARLEHVHELVERFSLLDSHYAADISRLESTQESGTLLAELPEGACPLCGADPKDHRHEGLMRVEDVKALTDACRAEAQKLQQLKSELSLTILNLQNEGNILKAEYDKLSHDLAEIQAMLINELEPQIKSAKEGFEVLSERRRRAERTLHDYDELRRLHSARSEFDAQSKQETSKKRTFEKIPPSATDQLAELVGEILDAWRYPGLDRVVFDTARYDIIINGKPRGSHGKGYRAITYSAFMVGVMLYCREHGLPHPGFVLLDSPLVTYRKPDKVESRDDLIDEGMVPPFYDYLSRLRDDCQVIVLENAEPSSVVRKRATYTHFTKSRDHGRYGFLFEPLAEASQATLLL